MNYIDLLTQEEKPILCRIITGRDFKELFKRNEQEFSKIRKGFRAKSLTEQQALSIAIVNVDKPFIAMWVNTRVDIWLKEIQENIEELEEEGSTHDIALASTMLDSVFANNVDLYLKLAGKTMDVDARSKLHERMESIKSERARNAEVADRIKVLEEEKRRLLDQIAAAQQSVNTIKAEYEQKIQELEQDKDTLELSWECSIPRRVVLRYLPGSQSGKCFKSGQCPSGNCTTCKKRQGFCPFPCTHAYAFQRHFWSLCLCQCELQPFSFGRRSHFR